MAFIDPFNKISSKYFSSFNSLLISFDIGSIFSIKTSVNLSNAANIIKYPIITDKATRLLENNKYSFIVDPKSDKETIKQAIEYLFDVKVIKVNTIQLPKKTRRVGKFLGTKSHYKKAIVTLLEGNVINLFAEN